MLWFIQALIWLVLIVALITLATSTLTYLFFWYEEKNSSASPLPLSEMLPAILRGIMSSFLSQAIVWLSYPYGKILERYIRRSTLKAKRKNSNRPPVLLVHGLYHNSSAWLAFLYWLKKSGFNNLHLYSYSSFNSSFEHASAGLDKKIASLRIAYPDTPPILIGHSLGGLLIRAWINGFPPHQHYSIEQLQKKSQSLRNVRLFSGAITLGTPHKGSKLAALAGGRLGKSIIFNGPLIAKLQLLDGPLNAPCFSLSSPIDNMVLPQAGLQLDAPDWEQAQIPPVSHIAMLYHKKTAQRLIDILRDLEA